MKNKGTYHIVRRHAQYFTTPSGGRRKEFIKSVCGKVLARDEDNSCNMAIANPSWNRDWCHDCVRAYPWTEDARKIWLEKGIEAMEHSSWLEWINSPEGEYARQ